jgi:peptide/nickel transport system substrate-binding protein
LDVGKPFFDSIDLTGGGDSLAATQAVLLTGEADVAWGAGGDPKVLAEMVKDAKGVIVHLAPVGGERLCVNWADPNTEVDGAKSEPSTKHPIFQHPEARQAINMSIPRDVLATEIAGGDAKPATNTLVAPGKFVSSNTTWKYDLDAAKALLAQVGVTGGKLLYQTSVLATRQKAQEVIKASLTQLGFDVELKSIDAAAFFSSDPGNPDTYPHFYADLEMFTFVEDSLYPINYMRRFRSDSMAQKSNNWSGPNITRYNNPEFDKLHDQAQAEMDPAKQVELFVQMNDMAVGDVNEIPLYIGGAGGTAFANTITGYVATPWTSPYYDIKNWTKTS